MNILYIDPVFGISGDMMLSALLHAGYPFDELKDTLKKIPYPLPRMTPEKITHGIIEGLHLNIEESHIHLTIKEMEKVMDDIEVNERIKADARAILDIIIDAESRVHGISKDELHFHELSNIDTLIDIIGVAAGIDYLGIERVYCGPIPCGRGTIKTSHGIIPNPPPVTLEILSGLKLVFFDDPLELTTPTGAAIVKHLVKEKNTLPPAMSIKKTGYGVGTYKSTRPDILRIFIGETDGYGDGDEVYVIEADMDDMEMEYVGAVAERIRDCGALDVLYFPVYMKKGRLGVRLSVITKNNMEGIIDTIFSETTTFGLRLRRETRAVLKRVEKTVDTLFGQVRVKYGYNRSGEMIKYHVEFEDIKRLAGERNIPYRDMLDAIKRELK